MEPVGILVVVLLVLNLAAILLTGQLLEREVRRHAVSHDESFAELARRSMTISAQIAETRKGLEALGKDLARIRAVDAESFEAFRAELWKRLDRLEGGTMDGTAEFEEGVRNLLAYTAGKVPGVEISL